MLLSLDDAAWDAPSMCSEWRVRDVAGHLIWRLGTTRWSMIASGAGAYFGKHISPSHAIAEIGREIGSRPVPELAQELRAIADNKVRGRQRVSIIELTEAIVHAYDMSEAIGADIRLSPRSTAAVVLNRLRVPGHGRTLARSYTLSAVDARWQLGSGPRIEASAGELTMHVFDRRRLELVPVSTTEQRIVCPGETSESACEH